MKRREKRHSKLPWTVFKAHLNGIEVRSKGGHVVCEIINNKATTLTTLMEDNAEFIARAANCHAELLRACKGLVENYGIDASFEPVSNWEHLKHIALLDALAAIAKATGEK